MPDQQTLRLILHGSKRRLFARFHWRRRHRIYVESKNLHFSNVGWMCQFLIQQLCQPSVDSCSAQLNTIAEPRKPRRLSDVGCMEATLFGGRIGHADYFLTKSLNETCSSLFLLSKSSSLNPSPLNTRMAAGITWLLM